MNAQNYSLDDLAQLIALNLKLTANVAELKQELKEANEVIDEANEIIDDYHLKLIDMSELADSYLEENRKLRDKISKLKAGAEDDDAGMSDYDPMETDLDVASLSRNQLTELNVYNYQICFINISIYLYFLGTCLGQQSKS